jgi:hypothetical protein
LTWAERPGRWRRLRLTAQRSLRDFPRGQAEWTGPAIQHIPDTGWPRLAIRANRPLFRLSTRRFKIAEPAATGQARHAMPQSKSKTQLIRVAQAGKSDRVHSRTVCVRDDASERTGRYSHLTQAPQDFTHHDGVAAFEVLDRRDRARRQ